MNSSPLPSPPWWLRTLQRLPPETAHNLTLSLLKFTAKTNPHLIRSLSPNPHNPSIDPSSYLPEQLRLAKNPIGLAAGFDKNAECLAAYPLLGFGFVEIGTVTPKPQAGNPKPRLFRLKQDHALINRMGFNNHGLTAVQQRIAQFNASPSPIPVGINIGVNKTSIHNPIADYIKGLETFVPLVHYIVLNISSPNTPHLRTLQETDSLEPLLDKIMSTLHQLTQNPPLIFIKIDPDLETEPIKRIADLACLFRINGIIATNTTLFRPSAADPLASQKGGLSGKPLLQRANLVLQSLTSHLQKQYPNNQLTIIAAGGIASGNDAYSKIRLGAHLVQLYTALVYQGPILLQSVKSDLVTLLKRDGFSHIKQAVGADL